MMKALKYDEIKIGDEASFYRKITVSDVKCFAELSGDVNPLHCDVDYAKTTQFGNTVIHGMLASSLFSQLVGMHLPGKYCLYVSQDLQFRNVIYPGSDVVVSGKVIAKMDAFKLLTIETFISDSATSKIYISGKAKVKVIK